MKPQSKGLRTEMQLMHIIASYSLPAIPVLQPIDGVLKPSNLNIVFAFCFLFLASSKDQIPHRLHAEHGTEEETAGGKPRLTDGGAR